MTPFYKIGIIALIVTAAFSSGFFYGREFERATALKNAANAYQSASEIQNEVNHLSDYALCIALGGVRDKCQVFLRGLDKAPLINEPAQLVKTEPQLTKWLIATNRFGTKQKCWK